MDIIITKSMGSHQIPLLIGGNIALIIMTTTMVFNLQLS